ncbi:MAG: hypothetical protein J3Q66DRAFT_410540 [Benniella sp.]|nr:MAG: hypothetical protein J3Q66DRAFT_410540 [Benniella sp.]
MCRDDVQKTSKGVPSPSSAPTSLPSQYKDIQLITLHLLGPRLNIGTLIFNALVTSSLRLDASMDPNVGCSTPSFVLAQTEGASATIFLDLESLAAGRKLMSDPEARTTGKGDISLLFRQLTSDFHEPSTYFACRSSDFITQQPATSMPAVHCLHARNLDTHPKQ